MAVAILISDRADFRARKAMTNKEKYYIKLKDQQSKITILNVYEPNKRTSNYYIRQKLTKLQGYIN